MRILLAGQAYYREDNGQAVFTVRLARGLRQAGHEVLVLAPSEQGTAASDTDDAGVIIEKVRALALPHNANISLGDKKKITQVLSDFSPDIIHLQDHYFLCRTVFRLGQRLKIPMVGTNHFLPDNITANLHIPSVLKKSMTAILWKHMLGFYNRLDSLSTPTTTAVSLLLEHNPRPAVRAISCGIDVQRFCPPQSTEIRQKLRQRFGFGEDEPVFIYVGRIDHEKGLATVVESFAALNNEKALLVLGGKGSYAATLKRRCEQLGITQQVRMPGFVPSEDLPLMLQAADCFIMAGFAELQSIATLEAMACGLPVLAAAARALPELVRSGVNGYLFTPQERASLAAVWKEFLATPQSWSAWGAASRLRAEQHALEKTVAQYVDWYREVQESH